MKSWKTTTAGVGALLTVIGTALNQMFDGNPATNPDWNLLLPIIITSLIGIFARDNNVTSEQVNAGNKTEATTTTTPPPSANHFGLWLVLGLLAFGLMGCASPQRPPSVAEQKYFEIRTNVVEVVTTVTNIVPATETTVAAIRVEPVTNKVEEYEFTPNANAGTLATTSAAVTSIWNPVAGGVVGAAIAGLFSLWGLFRSKNKATAERADVNQITAEELAQIIETGRQILLKLPEGAKYEAAYKAWMIKHQAQTGIIAQVAELVSASVDNEKAKGAAQTIVNLIQQTK